MQIIINLNSYINNRLFYLSAFFFKRLCCKNYLKKIQVVLPTSAQSGAHESFVLQLDPNDVFEANFVVAVVKDGHMMRAVEDLSEQEQWAASFDMTETDYFGVVVESLATA